MKESKIAFVYMREIPMGNLSGAALMYIAQRAKPIEGKFAWGEYVREELTLTEALLHENAQVREQAEKILTEESQ